jgi:hypothetical protein
MLQKMLKKEYSFGEVGVFKGIKGKKQIKGINFHILQLS